ncbi:xanthine dehydrogenase family protein subunit M, partial [Streptomyces sp. SID11233]|nr:xanthine dehydrogenase family protein subunit M [Streptomyces sp. SID11233]
AKAAEEFLTSVLDEERCWETGRPPGEAALRQFGQLASGACDPIDDVRGSAAYRRHAVGVMARRTFTWAWQALATEQRGNGAS